MKYFLIFELLLGLFLAGYSAIALRAGNDLGDWNYAILVTGLALIVLALRGYRRSKA